MKIKKTFYLIVFLFLSFNFSLSAQQSIPTNNDLRLSIQPVQLNNQLTVVGQVKNLSNFQYTLNYNLTVIRKGINYARESQKNKFILKPMEFISLGKIKVNTSSNSIFQIKFEIFYDTTLISYIEVSNELEESSQGTGLVIDESKTRNGHEFFELFNNQWMSAGIETNAMIKIEEKPLQLRSTQILVYVNDILLIRQRMRTRYDQIEEQANFAFNQIHDYLQKNPGLNSLTGEDDLKGNGLY